MHQPVSRCDRASALGFFIKLTCISLKSRKDSDPPSFGRIQEMNSSVFHEYHHLRCHQPSSVV